MFLPGDERVRVELTSRRDQRRILEQELDYSARLTLAPLAVAPFCAVVVVFLLDVERHQGWVWVWPSLYLLVCVLHWLQLYGYFERQRLGLPLRVLVSGQYFFAMAHGVMWGSAIWWYGSVVSFQETLIILCAQIGVTSANMFVYSPLRRSLPLFPFCLWSQTLLWLGWHRQGVWMLGCLGFLFVTVVINWQSFAIFRNEIHIRVAQRKLIYEIGQARLRAEAQNQMLAEKNAALSAALQEISYLAQHDALTGVPNRRAFMSQIRDFMGAGKSGVLAIADVDHFKRINDTYGHLSGDSVLMSIAKTLEPLIPADGFLARLGGEEFVILFDEVDSERALQYAEQLRVALERQTIDAGRGSLQVTLSIGLTRVAPGDTIESVLDRADQALYQAKLAGRNQVVWL